MAEPLSLPTAIATSPETSIATKHGIYRRKYRLRAAFRSVAFVALFSGYCVYNHLQPSTRDTVGTNWKSSKTDPDERNPTNPDGESSFAALGLRDEASQIQRSLDSDGEGPVIADTRQGLIGAVSAVKSVDVFLPGSEASPDRELADSNDLVSCDDIEKADPKWLLAFYFCGIIYMFLALAIVCDEFFVPALEEMSSERHMNLSMDVAGATLMAAGGSAPELFTSLFGTFQESEVGFGTIVGSAVFNVLFVIAMCSLLSKELLTLTWWPLFRDSVYYAFGLVVLAIFVGVSSDGVIYLWEAVVLFIMYLGYVLVMAFNRRIYRKITGKELSELGGVEDDEEEEQEEIERAPGMGSPSSRSMVDTATSAGPVSFRWPGTFRAGVLKLLRDPNSWTETAGVGIVAKIAGDVDHVFREVDLNGDGEIDKEELAELFQRLDCHVSAEELDQVFSELDVDKDGKISESEFTSWYIRSEERILSKVRTTFDYFDADNSGTIDRAEVKLLLEKLEPRVTDADVDEALEAMYQDGSRDEITFEEFSDWYIHSIIYDRQKKRVDEEMGGVWDNLKPPYGEGCFAYFWYVLVFPIVLLLTITVPDVRLPGLHKWCYLSFVVSIAWIGTYSYFMVDWAEIIGNTLGIPSVVMGLTFLAAGTSVPDLLSSVIVARRGQGDMAVSSSIGSNIFDILVGLPIPWILYTAWPTKPDVVIIGSDSVWYSIFILLAMLVFIILAIHCQGWKLTKTLGFIMFLFYFAFLAQAIVMELPFETCKD